MKMTFRALTADLYGGTAGVGLFLAEMAEATDDPDCRRTARAALRHAVSRSDDIPRGSRCGLYAGRPGIALALALAGRALDDPELDRAAREIVAGSPSSEPEGELDLMAGSAGAIVGLLTLSALLDDGEALISAATNHGDALLSSARHTATGLCWPSRSLPGEPGLTGWSHGAAGGAVALLELASATGEDRYRDAAEAAFAYERALFDPGARNWPDLRSAASANGSGQPTFATFWCHGAPGGALARLRALELGGGDELRQEARDALATTADWVEAALASGVNYSLCHGLAGNAEILLEGGSLLSAAPALGLGSRPRASPRTRPRTCPGRPVPTGPPRRVSSWGLPASAGTTSGWPGPRCPRCCWCGRRPPSRTAADRGSESRGATVPTVGCETPNGEAAADDGAQSGAGAVHAAGQEPGPAAAGDDAVRDRDRRLDRQRRAAVDRRAPALLPRRPLLGRQRLHADVRRLPAARRPDGRPAGATPDVHARPGGVLARLAGRRPRAVRDVADRRPRGPGPGCRDRLARGAVDHHHHVRRGCRAQPRARHLGRGRRAPAAPPACCWAES